jgi:His-Xaa-Ser system radical SAM maturase HxsC
MLTLGSRNVQFRNFSELDGPEHLVVTEQATLPVILRTKRAYVVRMAPVPDGFQTYIVFESNADAIASIPLMARVILLAPEYEYLSDGDVIRVTPRTQSVRALYRKRSPQNFLLVTERCNNFCLMCSQPPKRDNDSWLVKDILGLLPLIDRSTPELTITGGEPTLLGGGFFEILAACKSWLPETGIHVLSNGRKFADIGFAKRYAEISHPDVMVGIPLYSDISSLHDYVVQADGAFDETIRGILNLKRLGQRVEIRVVLHKQTYERLSMLAEFIARNLRFVDQVVLMGLEMTGSRERIFRISGSTQLCTSQNSWLQLIILRRIGCAFQSITISYASLTRNFGDTLESRFRIGRTSICQSVRGALKRRTVAASFRRHAFDIANILSRSRRRNVSTGLRPPIVMRPDLVLAD